MGSQRLSQKNLRKLAGLSLISRAARKCLASKAFDEIWINSEHQNFKEIALDEGVKFHQRPEALGSHHATSEQYIHEFLEHHPCDWVVQVHSIAPLLTQAEIKAFVSHLSQTDADSVLSYEPIQIECAIDSKPVNFTFSEKTNSQDLKPVQRIAWSISAWRRDSFLQAISQGQCATYAGKVEFFPISHFAAHVIKTEQDLQIAEALLPIVGDDIPKRPIGESKHSNLTSINSL